MAQGNQAENTSEKEATEQETTDNMIQFDFRNLTDDQITLIQNMLKEKAAAAATAMDPSTSTATPPAAVAQPTKPAEQTPILPQPNADTAQAATTSDGNAASEITISGISESQLKALLTFFPGCKTAQPETASSVQTAKNDLVEQIKAMKQDKNQAQPLLTSAKVITEYSGPSTSGPATNFIEKYELATEIRNWNDALRQLHFAENLKGEPLNWYLHSSFSNWLETKLAFTKRFTDQQGNRAAYLAIKWDYPGRDTFQSFYEKKKEAGIRVTYPEPLSEFIIVNDIYDCIPHAMKRWMPTRPNTFVELENSAANAQAIQQKDEYIQWNREQKIISLASRQHNGYRPEHNKWQDSDWRNSNPGRYNSNRYPSNGYRGSRGRGRFNSYRGRGYNSGYDRPYQRDYQSDARDDDEHRDDHRNDRSSRPPREDRKSAPRDHRDKRDFQKRDKAPYTKDNRSNKNF